MLKVPYGQDPYSVIGKYIREHITAIEDIIAVIEINDVTTNQLFMVDMDEENYFIWDNDWYEGEKDVTLIDFFPVSEAINPSAHPDIVRCKDCKHYGCILYSGTQFEYGECSGHEESDYIFEVNPDDFCSRAERRTDEHID